MKRALLVISGGVLLALVADRVFRRLVQDKVYARTLAFAEEAPAAALLANSEAATQRGGPGEEGLDAPRPFEEIQPFDEEADNWGLSFSGFGSGGATLFDANGDGGLDLYVARDGRTWSRPTDEDGVLSDERRYQANSLFLNMGNDARGHPGFERLDELVSGNEAHVAAELLVEDYMYPRAAVTDPVERDARISSVAVAADLDADGRLDLMVGNATEGSLWSDEETQRVLNRFIDPIGREARSSKLPLTSLINHFLPDYQARDGTWVEVDSARGREPEGANSLYLNGGDADGDGAPEWTDVSRESGVQGQRATMSVVMADIDLDGDLDVYAGNAMDMDMWPGGSTRWAGGINSLYVNQLADSGRLRFEERGAQYGVDGAFDEDYPQHTMERIRRIGLLPAEYSLIRPRLQAYLPEPMVINGDVAEMAEITWSTVFQDVNDDGYPDLWVANDLGILRLYVNEGGTSFSDARHARSHQTGNWMSLAPGDFDGDGHEDLVAGNLGGGMRNHAFVTPDHFALFDPVLTDAAALSTFVSDRHDPTHLIIDGADFSSELPHRVRHSAVMPPDTSLPNNVRSHAPSSDTRVADFETDTLDAYEFAWGMAVFDVQNDGRPDMYWVGCIYTRGGGLFPVLGTNPGRLLINATPAPGEELRLVDLTAEHHVFNIEELQYDRLESEGYVYRRSPKQNWRKRDMVYSHDRSVWTSQAAGIQERMANNDLVQTAENGRAAVGADINGDGFADLLVTNIGGYDSRSSDNKNLRAMVDGRPQVVPAPDNNYPTLTNFEPGRTRLFLNTYTQNNWIKVRLLDDSEGSFNRDAVGARVTVNEQLTLVRRAGTGGFVAAVAEDLIFGLGQGEAHVVEVLWPDEQRSVTRLELTGLARGTLVVSRTRGLLEWLPLQGGG